MADSFEYNKEAFRIVVTPIIKKATELLKQAWSNQFPKPEPPSHNIDFEKHILNHFIKIFNWSNSIEFIGLGQTLKITEKSVPLAITYNIRKLTKQKPDENMIEADMLVTDVVNYVILGDPGSGKSTTLKRLINHFFFTDNYKYSKYSYPLLVRFRDIKDYQNLYTYICDILGLRYETEEIEYTVKVEKLRTIKDKNNKLKEEKYLVEEKRKRFEYYIQRENLTILLPKLLEENNVLIAMDGLDEINYTISQDVLKQVSELASQLSNSKILVTCRPDYIEGNFPGFTFCQICDLSDPQIEEISGRWLVDTSNFLDSLKAKPYFDLAKRPLFLCFLLWIYKEEETLPITSQDVYRQIIGLLIERWDKDRTVKRTSAYAQFEKNKKIEFLTHLSFTLTFILKAKAFSNSELQAAYQKIRQRFQLPEDGALIVCREIENHTGLIVKAFYDRYEFSHLSIQEYLCAEFIVRGSYTPEVNEYIKESPAAIAMSIALSTNSSTRFAEVVFYFFVAEYSIIRETERPFVNKIAKTIVRKLLIEVPFFDQELYFGVAILALCRVCDFTDTELEELMIKFIFQHENVLSAVNLALAKYKFQSIDRGTKSANFTRIDFFEIKTIKISPNLIHVLSLPASLLGNLDESGKLRPLNV